MSLKFGVAVFHIWDAEEELLIFLITEMIIFEEKHASAAKSPEIKSIWPAAAAAPVRDRAMKNTDKLQEELDDEGGVGGRS